VSNLCWLSPEILKESESYSADVRNIFDLMPHAWRSSKRKAEESYEVTSQKRSRFLAALNEQPQSPTTESSQGYISEDASSIQLHPNSPSSQSNLSSTLSSYHNHETQLQVQNNSPKIGPEQQANSDGQGMSYEALIRDCPLTNLL
jgi:hypothetical protein